MYLAVDATEALDHPSESSCPLSIDEAQTVEGVLVACGGEPAQLSDVSVTKLAHLSHGRRMSFEGV